MLGRYRHVYHPVESKKTLLNERSKELHGNVRLPGVSGRASN